MELVGHAPFGMADATRCSSGIKASRSAAQSCTQTGTRLHGGDTRQTFGGDTGAKRTETRMVFIAVPLAVPAEDDSSVVEMIQKYFLRLATPGRETSSTRRGSVESCNERESNSLGANMDAGLEHEEWLLQQDVTRQLERCLTEAKASALHCRVLLLPRQMTARVGRDVVRSSADEPCGLRGASIKVYVDGKDGLTPAGCVLLDPSVTPTFELSVIFRAERDDGWPPLKVMFDTDKVMKLRPEYRLVKRKLYSSASPVIHDFN